MSTRWTLLYAYLIYHHPSRRRHVNASSEWLSAGLCPLPVFELIEGLDNVPVVSASNTRG